MGPRAEATVMEPVTSGRTPSKTSSQIWSDFQRILKSNGSSLILKKLERFAGFDARQRSQRRADDR